MRLSFTQFAQMSTTPGAFEAFDFGTAVVVEDIPDRNAVAEFGSANCVIIAEGAGAPPPWADLASSDITESEALEARIRAQPIACATLTGLLRHNERTSMSEGLLAESLAYSTLQHSSGFRTWLAQQPEGTKEAEANVLEVTREDAQLLIRFNRPQKHNAYNAQLRDALCEALRLALTDLSITSVSLSGAGASFCAGGDLTEFGEARDAGVAHVSRVTRSAGALLAKLAATGTEVSAVLHGACIGAGIELPSFAGRVVARQDTFFQLPEVAMGLVPGAGGTASITARIGRHRTAKLAISNERIDAPTALAWGLIDHIEG